MATARLYDNPLPFSLFCDLVTAISSVKPRSIEESHRCKSINHKPRSHVLLHKWINAIKQKHNETGSRTNGPLPVGTIVLFMRLLHPDQFVRRRYDMQESLLAKALETLFNQPEGTFSNWNALRLTSMSPSNGCLGSEVRDFMQRRARGASRAETLTLGRVDELLDELASKSMFSAQDVRRRTSRKLNDILCDLILPMSPVEVEIIIQVILQDLSPILYPLPTLSGPAALARFNTLAHDKIELHHTMREWHESMPGYFRVISDLDRASVAVEACLREGTGLLICSPIIGVPVATPRTRRPGPCGRVSKYLDGLIAGETKYDGERLQIHVDLDKGPLECIRIFSKSKRDSTEARIRLLPIIRASLGIPAESYDSQLQPLLPERVDSTMLHRSQAPRRLIIEGEMVPFNEERQCIDEFWRLPFAKTGDEKPLWPGSPQSSVLTGHTDSQDEETYASQYLRIEALGQFGQKIHLMVVWFDVLLVGDKSLLDVSYEERRDRLESLVQVIPGFSAVAHAEILDFRHRQNGLKALRNTFANVIAMRGEGLMLKPLDSIYNDSRPKHRWIKLKKDFIPGAGDTLEVHIVGATWRKERGRELLVPPSMYTTFFVGLRADELGADLGRTRKPHYHVLFSTSYGLDRAQLSLLNHKIRSSTTQPFSPDPRQSTTFRMCRRPKGAFTVFDSPSAKFTISLGSHLAGVAKSLGSPFYELRWPRVIKADREDGDPVDLRKLQMIAHRAMNVLPTDEASLIDSLWTTNSVGPRAGQDRLLSAVATDREYWLRKLEEADGVVADTDNEEKTPLARRPDTGWDFVLPTMRKAWTRQGAMAIKLERCSSDLTPRPAGDGGCTSRALLRGSRWSSSQENTVVDTPEAAAMTEQFRVSHSHMSTPATSLPNVRHESSPQLGRMKDSSTEKRRLGQKRPRLILPEQNISRLWRSLALSQEQPISSPYLPIEEYFWSIVSRGGPSIGSPRTRLAFLSDSNYLVNALDVLWSAGWIPKDRTVPYRGRLRQGYIFVQNGDEDMSWLKRNRGTLWQVQRKQLVWIVDRAALETSGQWHIGEAMLSVF
ncbi:hypothetical protein OIO90_002084 [Microbotryomycetes sp. JL221]|nr:hypothetical protein OIO90_002084 [Microbotryomycetes sp. JL221]